MTFSLTDLFCLMGPMPLPSDKLSSLLHSIYSRLLSMVNSLGMDLSSSQGLLPLFNKLNHAIGETVHVCFISTQILPSPQDTAN